MASAARFQRLATAVALAVSAVALGGQSPAPGPPAAVPALAGTWTLNFEASWASTDVVGTAPAPPAPEAPTQPVGPGTPTDGAGRASPWNDPTKTGSLIPQSVNNALNSTAPPKDKGRELTSDEKLLLEVTTPPSTLTVSVASASMTLTREGRTDTYVTNGAEEKHRCVNGSVKTKTWWGEGILRQEITVSKTVKLLRTFQLDDQRRLIVITRPADDKSLEFEARLISRVGADAGSKGRKRAVYDPGK